MLNPFIDGKKVIQTKLDLCEKKETPSTRLLRVEGVSTLEFSRMNNLIMVSHVQTLYRPFLNLHSILYFIFFYKTCYFYEYIPQKIRFLEVDIVLSACVIDLWVIFGLQRVWPQNFCPMKIIFGPVFVFNYCDQWDLQSFKCCAFFVTSLMNVLVKLSLVKC